MSTLRPVNVISPLSAVIVRTVLVLQSGMTSPLCDAAHQVFPLTRGGRVHSSSGVWSGTPLSQLLRTGGGFSSQPHFGNLNDGLVERCFRIRERRLAPWRHTKCPVDNRNVGPERWGTWRASSPLMRTISVFFSCRKEKSDDGRLGGWIVLAGVTFRPSVDWQLHFESPRLPPRG